MNENQTETRVETKTVIGCFEVERLGIQSWRIRNTLQTHSVYVTYGTWPEVHDQLVAQTEAWERRLGKQKHGSGWRKNMVPGELAAKMVESA